MRMFSLALLMAALSACQASTDDPAASNDTKIVDERDSSEMQRLFEADQAARQPAEGARIDWTTVQDEDAARRQRVRELLDEGQLRTGPDYYHAAFIFQHGSEPDDYLLTHVMATTAMALGHEPAKWIAAATLDRFLQSVDRSQVFGTQYLGGAGWTMGSYDDDMLTDAVREIHSVPTLEEQKEKLDSFANGG